MLYTLVEVVNGLILEGKMYRIATPTNNAIPFYNDCGRVLNIKGEVLCEVLNLNVLTAIFGGENNIPRFEEIDRNQNVKDEGCYACPYYADDVCDTICYLQSWEYEDLNRYVDDDFKACTDSYSGYEEHDCGNDFEEYGEW